MRVARRAEAFKVSDAEVSCPQKEALFEQRLFVIIRAERTAKAECPLTKQWIDNLRNVSRMEMQGDCSNVYTTTEQKRSEVKGYRVLAIIMSKWRPSQLVETSSGE